MEEKIRYWIEENKNIVTVAHLTKYIQHELHNGAEILFLPFNSWGIIGSSPDLKLNFLILRLVTRFWSSWVYMNDMEERSSCSLPACPPSRWQLHFFTGIRDCFLRIMAYTEDNLRHPFLQTNNYWILGLSVGNQSLLKDFQQLLVKYSDKSR